MILAFAAADWLWSDLPAGFVNLVLWPAVFARYATLAKTAIVLGVTGTLQAEQGVVHLVADRLWQPRIHADLATAPSRDFH